MSGGTTIELGELADETADKASDAAEATETTGTGKGMAEVALEAIDRLDEKGLLAPALFGPENVDSGVQKSESGNGHSADGMDLDADAIADVGKTVIDTMGDVRISEVVKYAEKNPEQVNQLIEKKMGE